MKESSYRNTISIASISTNMKVAVIGSRGFNDFGKLKDVLDRIEGVTHVVSGGAKGADTLAEQWAREKGIEIVIYRPDWAKFGRGAGVIRNRSIVEDCDRCIAFWDGTSKGTKSSIDLCRKLKKDVVVIPC
jgi:hypothetical protein